MTTTYKRSTFVPILSHSLLKAKEYTLTIRDIPTEDKPREKMEREGATVLSTPELLAVILNVGTKKEGVLEMATRMIKEYGEKSILSKKLPKELAEELDIPIGKVLQIMASVELGRRFFERNPNGATVIRNAEDVYEYTKNMHDLPKEHLRGIYLNSHYKVIHDEVISMGTIDANITHPREVFRPALEYAAAAVVLVHNHPSGVLTPSEADIAITNQLKEAGTLLGIDLIDHVIVSRNGFKSILSE